VEVYPGSQAGAVHSHGIPTTKEFENMLGGPSPNPFAPFNNQTDWELAKWAKLRGPGSTSFTELMGVTGVRLVSPLHRPSGKTMYVILYICVKMHQTASKIH
jgi:hypothetical protein